MPDDEQRPAAGSGSAAQLPLALRLARHASFASFVETGNAAAVAHVRAVAAGEAREPVCVWGEEGAGKSHLLQAACRLAGDRGRSAMYLAPGEDAPPGLLAELDAIDLIAIDDLHRIAGVPDWERPLFAAIEARYARGGLLLAADRAPAGLPFGLPDLASRAAGAVVYRLTPLSDEARLKAMMRHAELMGLELDEPTAAYVFQRVERDIGELVRWLERIDRAALVAQRRITIPFLRGLLDAGQNG